LPPKLTTSVVILEINRISVIIQNLVGALILFQDKRNTLEDKAIVQVFLDLTTVFAKTTQNLCQLLEKMEIGIDHSANSRIAELLNKLVDLSSSVHLLIEECLKALGHGYNYFEQYYEYDFVAKLKGLDLKSRLNDLNSLIDGCLTARKGAPDGDSPLTNLL
jgi:hypothetical protein